MKLWHNHRLDADAEWELPIEELARLYLASPWAGTRNALDTKLRIFLADQNGPVASVYDDSTPEYACSPWSTDANANGSPPPRRHRIRQGWRDAR